MGSVGGRWRTGLVIVAFAVSALLGACSGSDDKPSPTTAPPATVAVGVENGARVEALKVQSSDGASVSVEHVKLPSAGYVAVYADGEGAPGKSLGHSGLLAAGEHADVEVELDEKLSASGTVFVMLHVEDNGNQRFDFPKADRPVAADDGVMVTSLEIKVGS
jgi:hypothetical protein